MLYNILPPLIFFSSLGGIILIVSRVVVRVRNQQLTNTIKQSVAAASARPIRKTKQLARVIGPNQKSVRAMKNRLTLMTHTMRQSLSSVRREIKHKRKLRLSKKQIITEETVTEEVPSSASSTNSDAIQLPQSPFRERIAKMSANFRQAANRGVAAIGTVSQTSMSVLKERRQKRQATKAAEQAIANEPVLADDKALAKPSITLNISSLDQQQSASRATPKNKATETRSASGKQTTNLHKLFKKKETTAAQLSALDKARQALALGKYHKVDDIMVPYLVKHPRDIPGYMLLGKAAAQQENWTEAVEIYEQVVRLNPTNKGLYAALGEAAFKTGKFTKAIEYLQRAHNDDPTNIAVIEYLLTIAQHMDNTTMQRSLTEELTELAKQQT